MIGDADLTIYREQTSNKELLDEIWTEAYSLGYAEVFMQEEKHAILDDHTPFLDAGIPAVDIIDIEYPYWHTTEDTEDKVSPESLKIVGNTILNWLLTIGIAWLSNGILRRVISILKKELGLEHHLFQ